jgi:hypothetical protein
VEWYCVHVHSDIQAWLWSTVYVYAVSKKCQSGDVPFQECLESMNLMLILQSGAQDN